MPTLDPTEKLRSILRKLDAVRYIGFKVRRTIGLVGPVRHTYACVIAPFAEPTLDVYRELFVIAKADFPELRMSDVYCGRVTRKSDGHRGQVALGFAVSVGPASSPHLTVDGWSNADCTGKTMDLDVE